MRRLLAALAALALASGTAAAESPLAGHTLSCSIAGSPVFGGCYYEVPLTVLGPLSFSVGLDAHLATPDSGRESYAAPYVLLVLELGTWSAWGEFAAPSSWGIPVIGRSPAWRAGFTVTFQ
jgi:hypothetical protein